MDDIIALVFFFFNKRVLVHRYRLAIQEDTHQ